VDGKMHALRPEQTQRAEGGGYRAHCRCGEPFEAATMGAAHDLVFGHVKATALRR
jgi:hypothetical protein